MTASAKTLSAKLSGKRPVTKASHNMAEHSLPWDQRPGYLAATAAEVLSGGLTAYRKMLRNLCPTLCPYDDRGSTPCWYLTGDRKTQEAETINPD